MSKKNKTRNGRYITYPDNQSLGETHDMIVKALPGQSYVKESLNKVSTTQVTGDALMKVAVGGKGGFAAGTAGDVREKKKELNAELIRMEKKEIWMQRLEVAMTLGYTDGKINTTTQKVYCPSHIFGEREIKGWIELSKTIGRDYDDFTYQGELDASDHMRNAEFLLAGTDELDRIRKTYDEICGYHGAWKYVGLEGREHRRYRIYVANTLDLQTSAKKSKPYDRDGYMSWEGSSYNHHVVGPNFELYHDMKNGNVRKDCIEYTLMQLSKIKNDTNEWLSHNLYDDSAKYEPSEDFLREKEEWESLERKRRFEAFKNAPDLSDWKVVYKWELTKKGKVMFANEKI